MTRRSVRAAVALVGALVILALGLRAGQLVTGEPGPGQVDRPVESTSTADQGRRTSQEIGELFLSRYVEPSGRVARHDQGGDTVSEGQAYAMLVAAALKDRTRFQAVWTWTQENLLRPDGLLAWRWQDGRVVDAESASDADLDAARALVIAAEVFGDDRLEAEGVRLAKAVLDEETVMTDSGRMLVAGSWAVRDPYGYNPSYASPVAHRGAGRGVPRSPLGRARPRHPRRLDSHAEQCRPATRLGAGAQRRPHRGHAGCRRPGR